MNKEEREKLKNQVMDMILTGYSQREIAHRLGISLRSIVTYVKCRRQETIDEMRITAEEQMAEMEMNRKKRTQKLWAVALDDTKKPRDRSKAIQLLQNEDQLSIKRKQIIGMLPSDKQEIEHTGTPLLEGITINIIKPEDYDNQLEANKKTVPGS